jgi:trans-aconitate methyltransferase
VKPDAPLIDVGGGASVLVDALLGEGYSDLTVLDISVAVLGKVRERLGERSARVTLIQGDVTAFQPAKRFALWHDRAVFHFLVTAEDRARYVESLRSALLPEGQVVIATFGPQGPERCSGLSVQRYDAATLNEALGNDFRLLRSSLEEHRTPAGAVQQFLYTLYQRA